MKPGKFTYSLQRMSSMRGFIWLFPLTIALLAVTATTYANDNDGHKSTDRCDDKTANKSAAKTTAAATTPVPAPLPTITAKPTRVEEYVWMLSRENDETAVEDGNLENAVVDLYKWYLQNETRINSNDYLKGGGKALVFPFKIDVKTLQQYFQFIKNNFPGLSEDDLDNNAKKPLANRKKYAPVTERDDMENPMSIAVPK